MNVQPLQVTRQAAQAALKEYNQARAKWDKRDVEIARIYRQIARGNTVISVHDAIRRAGVDGLGRPRLAIMRADQKRCSCVAWSSRSVVFTNEYNSLAAEWHFEIEWPDRQVKADITRLAALLPRIPPQHRPDDLGKYHILWEADWTAIPRDPYLLKRVGEDAWVVLAAWDLTDVEVNVLGAAR
jgi:hypothetical protein